LKSCSSLLKNNQTSNPHISSKHRFQNTETTQAITLKLLRKHNTLKMLS
jgi:hypothetical protein